MASGCRIDARFAAGSADAAAASGGSALSSSANRSRTIFQEHQSVGIRLRVRQRWELAPQLVVLAHLFPNRTHDMNHLPVRDPFSAGAFALFTFATGDRFAHAGCNALL